MSRIKEPKELLPVVILWVLTERQMATISQWAQRTSRDADDNYRFFFFFLDFFFSRRGDEELSELLQEQQKTSACGHSDLAFVPSLSHHYLSLFLLLFLFFFFFFRLRFFGGASDSSESSTNLWQQMEHADSCHMTHHILKFIDNVWSFVLSAFHSEVVSQLQEWSFFFSQTVSSVCCHWLTVSLLALATGVSASVNNVYYKCRIVKDVWS